MTAFVMNIGAGTKLGRYEIRAKIGAGGMGEVYLAQDTKLDRKVALKILPAEVASQRDRMARFVREAKSAAALNHPNIAHIYEIGSSPFAVKGADSHSTTNQETHYIAMEFIDGQTLRQLIHSGQPELPKLLRLGGHQSRSRLRRLALRSTLPGFGALRWIDALRVSQLLDKAQSSVLDLPRH